MKQFFSTALCVVIALVLVSAGVLWGADRGWRQELAQMETLYAQPDGLGGVIARRAITAGHLRLVALRHLPADDADLAALDQALAAVKASGLTVDDAQAADHALGQAAHTLADRLMALDSVQVSVRDYSYVDSLLREMDQLAASPAVKAFEEARTDYTKRLETSLSGKTALVLGASAQPMAQLPELAPVYPDKAGAVVDHANVLSAQMAEEIHSFHDNLMDETATAFHVATVHFLNGRDIKTYAQGLFEAWQLGENDLLLVWAVGEDHYYTLAGSALEKKFPAETQQVLLSQQMQSDFMAQRYDQAMRSYIPALAETLEKQLGARIRLPGSMASAQVTPAPTVRPDWRLIFASGDDNWAEEEAERTLAAVFGKEEKSSGISLGKTIVLAFILYLIFGKKGRHSRHGCMGCGCSPIGWILAAFGLQKFFDNN